MTQNGLKHRKIKKKIFHSNPLQHPKKKILRQIVDLYQNSFVFQQQNLTTKMCDIYCISTLLAICNSKSMCMYDVIYICYRLCFNVFDICYITVIDTEHIVLSVKSKLMMLDPYYLFGIHHLLAHFLLCLERN